MMCGDMKDMVYRALIGDVKKRIINGIEGAGVATFKKGEKYIRDFLEKGYEDLGALEKELKSMRISDDAKKKVLNYVVKLHEKDVIRNYIAKLSLREAGIDAIERDNDNYVDDIVVDFSKYGIDTVGEAGDVSEEKNERDEGVPHDGEPYVTRGVKEWNYDQAIHPREIIHGSYEDEDEHVKDPRYEDDLVKGAKYYAFYRGALKNNFENRGIKKLAGRWDSKKAEEIIKMYRSGADEIDPFVLEAAFDVVAHAKGYDYLKQNYGKELKKFGVQRKRMLESWGMDDGAFKHVKYSENLANDIYRFVKDNKDKIAKAAAYAAITATVLRALEDPDTFMTAINNLITGKATYYPHAAPTAAGAVLGGMAGLWAEEKLVKYKDSIKSGASRIWNGLKTKLNKLTSRFEYCPLEG